MPKGILTGVIVAAVVAAVKALVVAVVAAVVVAVVFGIYFALLLRVASLCGHRIDVLCISGTIWPSERVDYTMKK